MKTNEIVKAIREQQIECSKYVYIKILTEEEIEKLLLEGNYFYCEENSKILASGYMKPLLTKPLIYRVGGLSILNSKSPSLTEKKAVVKILVKLQTYILKHNIAFIMNTNTNSIESFAINIGAKKLSFEECLEQYPLYLKLYLDDSVEDREFFKSRTFYVREAKI